MWSVLYIHVWLLCGTGIAGFVVHELLHNLVTRVTMPNFNKDQTSQRKTLQYTNQGVEEAMNF